MASLYPYDLKAAMAALHPCDSRLEGSHGCHPSCGFRLDSRASCLDAQTRNCGVSGGQPVRYVRRAMKNQPAPASSTESIASAMGESVGIAAPETANDPLAMTVFPSNTS